VKKIILLSVLLGGSSILYGATDDAMGPQAQRFKECSARQNDELDFLESADEEMTEITRLLDAGDVEKEVIEEKINAFSERWRSTGEYLEELQRKTVVLEQPCYVFKKPVTQVAILDDEATDCSGSSSEVSDVSEDTVDVFDDAIFAPEALEELMRFGLQKGNLDSGNDRKMSEFYIARAAAVKPILMAAKKALQQRKKRQDAAAAY
jgi:hypothetical protein